PVLVTRGDPTAVGAESNIADIGVVSPERDQVLACNEIPHSYGLVRAHRRDPLAVGAEGEFARTVGQSNQRADEPSGPGVPVLDARIIAARDHPASVGADFQASDDA